MCTGGGGVSAPPELEPVKRTSADAQRERDKVKRNAAKAFGVPATNKTAGMLEAMHSPSKKKTLGA